ncbi:hypothetical protein [Cupriavidus basilensis]|uniref:hypothetical protein n=1 Tax=Cupriavidus basilensis TaxID=68895 RepID=UPI0002E791A8|nr:hypothetical protein [Cupriavidus basilensis]
MSGSDSLLPDSAIETFKSAIYQKYALSRDCAPADAGQATAYTATQPISFQLD